jgi:CubicO group peptidase (beta-lactamase class C family)
VLADAAEVSAGDKGEVSYSNLGVALLGLALADDAATSYPELLTERILNPLGMDNTAVASTDDELPANRAYGSRANGRAAEPWFEFGWGGAGGGVWSTSHDVAALLLGLMDRTAPGADATTPRFDAGTDEQIGYGWFTTERDGRSITWHNGGTGGISTWAGFDAEAGTGAVVLGNTDRDVDSIGRALLDLDQDSSFDWRWLFLLAVALGFSLYGGLVVVMNRRPDRIGLVRDAALGVLLLLVAKSIGTWEVIPPVVWLLGVAALAAATVKVVLGWPELPLRAYGRHWTRVAGAAANVLLLIGLVALLVAT